MYYFAFLWVREKKSNHPHLLKFESRTTLFSFYFLVSLLKYLPTWSFCGEIYQLRCCLRCLATISICFQYPYDTIRCDKKNLFWRNHSLAVISNFWRHNRIPSRNYTAIVADSPDFVPLNRLRFLYDLKQFVLILFSTFWVQIFKCSPCHIIFIKINRIGIGFLYARSNKYGYFLMPEAKLSIMFSEY